MGSRLRTMKTLLIIGLMIIGPLGGQNKSAYQHQHQTQEAVYAAFFGGGDPTAQPEQRGTANEPNHIFYDWLWEPIRLSWPLVAVGIGGVWAALRTLQKIARQTAAIEKDLVLTQRPRIIVRNLYLVDAKIAGQIAEGLCVTQPISVILSIVNTGGTTAHIVEKYCEIRIEHFLPTKPIYEGKRGDIQETEIPPGAFVSEKFDRKEALTENERSGIQDKRKFIYVLGWIGYMDDLKTYRRMAFCRMYNFGSRRFDRTEDPDYEYSD